MRAHAGVRASCAAWALLALGGCVGTKPPQALYAGPERPGTEIAELHGVVEYVDGQRVSGGKFALLPGCHVVRPPTALGQSSATEAQWMTLPEMHFSLPMRAGYRYQIATSAGHMDGTGAGQGAIRGLEMDTLGTVVRTFPAFAGQGSAAACEAEAAVTPAPEAQ